MKRLSLGLSVLLAIFGLLGACSDDDAGDSGGDKGGTSGTGASPSGGVAGTSVSGAAGSTSGSGGSMSGNGGAPGGTAGTSPEGGAGNGGEGGESGSTGAGGEAGLGDGGDSGTSGAGGSSGASGASGAGGSGGSGGAGGLSGTAGTLGGSAGLGGAGAGGAGAGGAGAGAAGAGAGGAGAGGAGAGGGGNSLVSLLPQTLSLYRNGGTGLLTVTLSNAAPPGGQVIQLSAATGDIAVPASVTVPAGSMTAAFRVRANATGAASATVIASLGKSSQQATVNVVTVARVPQVGDIVINEVNFDVATEGDANCSGATSAEQDEFVELVNGTAEPLDLMGVSLWDDTAWGGASGIPRYQFATFVLGPGEPVVVFGGGTFGTTTALPWCINASPQSIGDARAFAGAPLSLNNGGDTLYVTAIMTVHVIVASFTFADGSDESLTRSPDVTGSLVRHSLAPGHATDRSISPGTRLTGAPFALANP